MKTTKCWYAIAHNSDMQRIEIHGATKTVVETGTEVIRDKIFKWLGACARGQVDMKRIIQNTTARYYILPEKCNADVALSTNTSQLRTQRAMKHSRDTKQDLEGTLQILLPPIERSILHSKCFGVLLCAIVHEYFIVLTSAQRVVFVQRFQKFRSSHW
jgi:hypothetical protein